MVSILLLLGVLSLTANLLAGSVQLYLMVHEYSSLHLVMFLSHVVIVILLWKAWRSLVRDW